MQHFDSYNILEKWRLYCTMKLLKVYIAKDNNQFAIQYNEIYNDKSSKDKYIVFTYTHILYSYVHIFSHERFNLNRHLRRLWDVLSSSFSYIIENLNGRTSYTMYGVSLILLTFFTRFQRSLSSNENYNENRSPETYEIYQKLNMSQ